MQLLSDREAYAWAGMAGIAAADPLQMGEAPGGRVRIQLPGPAPEVVGVAYMLAAAFVPEHDEERFRGALVWLRAWEIWSESIDRAGYVLLDGLRASSAEAREVGAAPAHLFGPGEFAAAHACLALPMLFQWDAHYLTAGGELAAFVSHDGWVDMACRDEAGRRAVEARFGPWRVPAG